jgi:uncharacterized Rmd1/YagE family protein
MQLQQNHRQQSQVYNLLNACVCKFNICVLLSTTNKCGPYFSRGWKCLYIAIAHQVLFNWKNRKNYKSLWVELVFLVPPKLINGKLTPFGWRLNCQKFLNMIFNERKILLIVTLLHCTVQNEKKTIPFLQFGMVLSWNFESMIHGCGAELGR